MCGPLMLALPLQRWSSPFRFVLGRVAHQAGRVAMYCVLGVVFGLIGRTLFIAGLQRWTSVALGILLVLGGVGSSRWLKAVWMVAWPNRLRGMMARRLEKRMLSSLLILGALNGLLPCGLVYAAGAGAVATGELGQGVAYMALFGLGTVPMMLGMGVAGGLLRPSVRMRLNRLASVSVYLLGILLILRGLGLGIPYLSPDVTSMGESRCCSVVSTNGDVVGELQARDAARVSGGEGSRTP
jgi:sulfite exporter TauE/SafE